MDKEKIIDEIITYLKKDRGVKKHAINGVKPKPTGNEIVVYWNTANFGTAKPVLRRVYEVYGDVIASIDFHKNVTLSRIEITL